MMAPSFNPLVASIAALIGSLYYCFMVPAPGAGIPRPYCVVPVIAALTSAPPW